VAGPLSVKDATIRENLTRREQGGDGGKMDRDGPRKKGDGDYLAEVRTLRISQRGGGKHKVHVRTTAMGKNQGTKPQKKKLRLANV